MELTGERARLFETIRARCTRLESEDAARVATAVEMREMFQMEWSGAPTADWIRKMVSPDAYNAVMGLVRLMMAAELTVSVPGEGGEMGADAAGHAEVEGDDRLERGLRAVLRRADESAPTALVDDAVMSACLFGEVAIRVGCSADVIALAEEQGNGALARVAGRVPYTFEVLNPVTVFSRSDLYGVREVAVIEEAVPDEVREMWGERASHVPGGETEDITYYDYWDRKTRCVWVSSATEPILLEEHGLPFIPIVRKIVQGTSLWTLDEGATVFPLLYALAQSGMWNAQNIALTMVYSIAYGMGSVPFVVLRKKNRASPDPEIDWTRPGINATLYEDQSIELPVSGVVPDGMVQLLNLAEGKAGETLVPKVVFGSAPSGNMSFSAINLLSQGGRLPLVPIQTRTADALARALEVVLLWVDHRGEAAEVYGEEGLAALDPELIDPARLAVRVGLRPDLPQDRLSLVAAITQLIDRQVISLRTAREWINILDSTGETEQVLLEQYVQEHAEALKAKLGGSPPSVPRPPSVPPDSGGEGAMFNPAAGGLPPVMAGGQPVVPGMMPGDGGGPGGELDARAAELVEGWMGPEE